ncbi:valine--tRNA ligase [Ascosphaera pollenicola]|nr:valine--tRNA ligase [Ascosphaera pollenicola]
MTGEYEDALNYSVHPRVGAKLFEESLIRSSMSQAMMGVRTTTVPEAGINMHAENYLYLRDHIMNVKEILLHRQNRIMGNLPHFQPSKEGHPPQPPFRNL